MSKPIYTGDLHLNIKEAAKIAAAWKSKDSDPRGREVACQLFGTSFVVQIDGTKTKFRFNEDGTVETINANRNSNPKRLHMDYSKAVLGYTRRSGVIYA